MLTDLRCVLRITCFFALFTGFFKNWGGGLEMAGSGYGLELAECGGDLE